MSRFVEDVERDPAWAPLQLGRKLDALGLVTGEFCRRLIQAQVAATSQCVANLMLIAALAVRPGFGRAFRYCV